MANLKEVRIRITSVISTQQITKAMKMVSASKLRRAQNSILQIRPYTTKLQEVMANIQKSLEGDINMPLAEVREVKNVLVVCITSDKGLCGGFNTNIIKRVKHIVDEQYAEQKAKGNVTILAIGRKGNEFFSKRGYQVDSRYWEILNGVGFEVVSPIVAEIIADFEAKKYDAVEVVYSKFKNAATQIFNHETLLPIGSALDNDDIASGNTDYIFEPSKDEILNNLMPTYLKIQFYRYILDNLASEHGARMTSMDKATENAGDLLRELKLQYNRARQAAITTEISEIVGGVAALDG